MRRVVSPNMEYPAVLASDVGQVYQTILDRSWKVSGCGLGQGALSCALFLSQYAASFEKVDLTAKIQELFDRGCHSVVSGKTCWLDFADLALVTHRLSARGFVQIEQAHFFEDIDKLALAAIEHPVRISGFENSELGAVLYALRRFNAGAGHFSGPIMQFASALATGVSPVFVGPGENGNENLRSGLSAPLLCASLFAEIGLLDDKEGIGGISMLVGRVCENVNGLASGQIDPGFQTGELGKGYALLRAGICFQQGEWMTTGLQIVIDCAYAVLDQGIGTLDMSSGAAGVALAFDKLYRLSGYDIFRTVASKVKWLSLKAGVIIDDRNIDHGCSFYYGLSGIGLAALHWQQGRIEELDDLLWLL
jgi:hypothetical protein